MEIDARVVPTFFFTIFFLLNSGLMRIDLCAIVLVVTNVAIKMFGGFALPWKNLKKKTNEMRPR